MTVDNGVVANVLQHQWWSIFTKIATVIMVPILAWLFLMIFEISTTVAVIQSNRFTDEEGDMLERRIDAVEIEQARRESWGEDVAEIKETLKEIMRILSEQR